MNPIDAHYRIARLAALYDFDSPWAADTDFYIDLAGESPIRVLDVGCGTGTLALGLAARGHLVTAVDPAEAMIAVARSKAGAEAVNWQVGCAQGLDLDGCFDLIVMTGHAFQVLLTEDDIRLALGQLARHLASCGRLAFESRNPEIDWAARWRTEDAWQVDGGCVTQTRSDVVFDGEYARFRHTFRFADDTLVSDSTLRFCTPPKLMGYLADAGLSDVRLLGDWSGSAFDSQASEEIIVIAKR